MRSTYLALPLIAIVSLVSCKKSEIAAKGDVTFARNTFTALAKGDTAVQDKIDWPTFTALGGNIGADYIKIPTETEKAQFRNEFVTGFATSFRQSGGSVDNFTNWRTTFHDSTRTEVAADSPNGILKLTVSERDSVERISAIDLMK